MKGQRKSILVTRMITGQAAESDGWAWDVDLIVAGFSQNGWNWTPDVLEAVCGEVGLAVCKVLSRSRRQELARARRLVAWVWCEVLGFSQTEIADLLGLGQPAISKMISYLRISGVGQRSSAVVAGVLGSLERKSRERLELMGRTERAPCDRSGAEVLLLKRAHTFQQPVPR